MLFYLILITSLSWLQVCLPSYPNSSNYFYHYNFSLILSLVSFWYNTRCLKDRLALEGVQTSQHNFSMLLYWLDKLAADLEREIKQNTLNHTSIGLGYLLLTLIWVNEIHAVTHISHGDVVVNRRVGMIADVTCYNEPCKSVIIHRIHSVTHHTEDIKPRQDGLRQVHLHTH